VVNSSLCGIIVEALQRGKITGIYGAINGILGVLREEFVDLRQEEPASVWGLRETPSAALGSCRYKLTEHDYNRLMEVFEAHEIGYFLYAGGNDSQDTAHRVARLAADRRYDLRVVGVPKTVDNDLLITDHCPGYGSVARFNAMVTRDSGLDTEAIYTSDTIKIIETMGRDTGWIAASTALAKEDEESAPNLIYFPEHPFIVQEFLDDVKAVFDRLGRAVICVCEGLRDERGALLNASAREIDTDAFGHAQLGGVGDYLANLISEKLKIKARCDRPGTIQRVSMLCASQMDLAEAYRVGQFAMSKAVEGETDKMVTLMRRRKDPYQSETCLVELDNVALKTKKMPDEFIDESANFVTKEFIDYATPLIGGPLPEYSRLKKKSVERRLPPYSLDRNPGRISSRSRH
jgi:6-phosphofructokinase